MMDGNPMMMWGMGLLWLLVVATGLGGVALGASVFVEAWQASRAWAGSGEAATETLWFELREKIGASAMMMIRCAGNAGCTVSAVNPNPPRWTPANAIHRAGRASHVA